MNFRRAIGAFAVVGTVLGGAVLAHAEPILAPNTPPPIPVVKIQKLDNAAKVKAIVAVLGAAAAAEKDLDTPFRLTPRNPVLNPDTYLSAIDAASFEPMEGDTGYIQTRPDSGAVGHPFVSIRFKAEPNRAYLIDCIALSSGGSQKQFVEVTGEPTAISTISLGGAGGHATAVVRKAAAARTVSFSLSPAPNAFRFSGCEVTPVK